MAEVLVEKLDFYSEIAELETGDIYSLLDWYDFGIISVDGKVLSFVENEERLWQ